MSQLGQTQPEARLVRVRSIQDVAIDTRLYELVSADGRPLAPYEAGAHIDVQVPNGMMRQYSLCGSPGGSAYRMAVKREAGGRGGSMSLHDHGEVGTALGIFGPRNHFPLDLSAQRHLFIAGGIGITPIHSMVHTLVALGRPWTLHYCARSAAHAAFHEELVALAPPNVFCHFSEQPVLDVQGLLHTVEEGTHVVCCGPQGLMQAVQAATAHWPPEQVHFEWFSAPQLEGKDDAALDAPFEVHLARTGRTFVVPAHASILDVLRDEGIRVNCACESGVCGTCETTVLEGRPQHRDALLSDEERSAGRTMMICVSRAESPRLVLDL